MSTRSFASNDASSHLGLSESCSESTRFRLGDKVEALTLLHLQRDMCRWIAYFSYHEPILVADLVIRPAHSLLRQVDEHYLPGLQLDVPSSANDRGSPNNLTNVDGFGIGFYSQTPAIHQVHSSPSSRVVHPELLPAVYKCISPPVHDLNLHSLAHAIESRVVFGHIRASTTGMVQLQNCHPFQWGRFLFQHNGRIGKFADIQIELMSLVGPRARSFVKGTTDTEWLAALFFHTLDPSETATWLEDFSLARQLAALSSTISTIIRLVERSGGYFDERPRRRRRRRRAGGATTTTKVLASSSDEAEEELVDWFSANVAVTDGERMFALRYAYPDRFREAPSLYYSTTAGSAFDRKYDGHPDDGGVDVPGTRKRESHQSHVVVASEPMSWDEGEWDAVRPGEIVSVERDGEPRLTRFRLTAPVVDFDRSSEKHTSDED